MWVSPPVSYQPGYWAASAYAPKRHFSSSKTDQGEHFYCRFRRLFGEFKGPKTHPIGEFQGPKIIKTLLESFRALLFTLLESFSSLLVNLFESFRTLSAENPFGEF